VSSPEDTRESTRFHSEPPAFFRYLEGKLVYFSLTTPTSWTLSPGPLLQSVTVLMVMSLVLGHGRAEDIVEAATDSTTSQAESLPGAWSAQHPQGASKVKPSRGALLEGLHLCQPRLGIALLKRQHEADGSLLKPGHSRCDLRMGKCHEAVECGWCQPFAVAVACCSVLSALSTGLS